MTHQEEKANLKAKKLEEKAPTRKARIELLKTIALTAVITAVIAFISGVHYANNINASKTQAVNSAVHSLTTKQ